MPAHERRAVDGSVVQEATRITTGTADDNISFLHIPGLAIDSGESRGVRNRRQRHHGGKCVLGWRNLITFLLPGFFAFEFTAVHEWGVSARAVQPGHTKRGRGMIDNRNGRGRGSHASHVACVSGTGDCTLAALCLSEHRPPKGSGVVRRVMQPAYYSCGWGRWVGSVRPRVCPCVATCDMRHAGRRDAQTHSVREHTND